MAELIWLILLAQAQQHRQALVGYECTSLEESIQTFNPVSHVQCQPDDSNRDEHLNKYNQYTNPLWNAFTHFHVQNRKHPPKYFKLRQSNAKIYSTNIFIKYHIATNKQDQSKWIVVQGNLDNSGNCQRANFIFKGVEYKFRMLFVSARIDVKVCPPHTLLVQ